MPLHVDWMVKINGRDVSKRMNPYIESIECSGSAGGKADAARLVFDDTDGQVFLPAEGSRVEIYILGRLRFRGFTDAPESIGAREGSGQTLEVSCKGFDKGGKVKQSQRSHKDDCSLKDWMDHTAKAAGIKTVKVDPEFAKIKRRHWSTRGRNFLQIGQAFADELGGTFVVRGDTAVLAKRGNGLTPGGNATPTIYATKPGNLITWRLSPHMPRAKFAKARVRYYDRKGAKWKEKDVEIGPSGAGGAVDLLPEARSDEDSAERAGKGRKAKSEREGGGGTLYMEITVEAEVEGTVIVTGSRPGMDGTYRIDGWRDRVTRTGSGSEIEVKQPQAGAGTDSRNKAAA